MSKRKIDFKNLNFLFPNFEEYFNNTQPYETPEHPWNTLPDAEKAVKTILSFKDKDVLIVGDYDSDGTNASAIVKIGLDLLGFTKVSIAIPDRFKDGYGLSQNMINRVLSLNPDLVITVDNGIVAVEQIKTLTDSGIEVVVTDHHEPLEDGTIPNCAAVVDQKRLDSNYSFKEICGAYVAYKIIQGCFELENKPFPKEIFLPFATNASISDVMPVLNENRTLVKEGIKLISENPNQVYRAFFNLFPKVKQHNLKADDFGYYFGPIVNCDSRLTGNTDDVMKMFLNYNNKQICEEQASKLFKLNQERKKLQTEQNKDCDTAIEHFYPDIENTKVPVVIAKEGFHHGLIGINAGHISEVYGVPAFVISVDKETGKAKGSARSINEISALDMIRYCSDIVQGGGHKGAAGFSLEAKDIPLFRNKLIEYSNKFLSADDYKITTDIACELKFNDINLTNYEKIKSREPYGLQNEEPLFYGKFSLSSFSELSNNTVVLNFSDINDPTNMKVFSAISFSHSEIKDILEQYAIYEVIFKLNKNSFRGNESVQILIEAIQKI